MDNDSCFFLRALKATHRSQVDFANRLDVTETIADVLATPLRLKKDGTSFAKLVETLTAVDATSFCIAVEVKQEEQKIRKKKEEEGRIFSVPVLSFQKAKG